MIEKYIEYKIRRRADGLFSDGGQMPTFSVRVRHGEVVGRYYYKDCDIVIYEVEVSRDSSCFHALGYTNDPQEISGVLALIEKDFGGRHGI